MKNTQSKDPDHENNTQKRAPQTPENTGGDRQLLAEARNAEIARVYRRLATERKAPPGVSSREHYERVLEDVGKSPATSYFVTYDYALRKTAQARRGELRGKDGTANGKWAELAQRADDESRRQKITRGEALSRVLSEGQASSFFLGKWGVKLAITKHRRRVRRNRDNQP